MKVYTFLYITLEQVLHIKENSYTFSKYLPQGGKELAAASDQLQASFLVACG